MKLKRFYSAFFLICMLVATLAPTRAEAAPPGLLKLYRSLHAHPELSFQEQHTAQRISSELNDAGFQVTSSVGGNGVVGVLHNGDGPTVLIRTDMDALPIKEQTGLPFASTVTEADRGGQQTPVMHACGHDVHMTVFVGTARRLVALRKQWHGTVVMIGQPAEERSGGAKAMLADGLFTRFPRPDYNLALHVSSDLPAGTVGAASGYFMANVDSVDIIVHGIGGHGAYPDKARDPIVLAAQLVGELQTIVSREVSPLEPAVVTVGSIHGGSQHNIIPDRVKLQLTLRSYSATVRDQTIAAIRRMAEFSARAQGMPDSLLPEVTVLDEHTPAAYNDPRLTRRVLSALEQHLGKDRMVAVHPEMVGEDFGRYGAVSPRIPSLMFRLGSVSKARFEAAQRGELHLPTLHSAHYAPDPDPTISTGVAAMTQAVLSVLNGAPL